MNHFAVPMKLKHCKSTIAQYKIKQTNKQTKKNILHGHTPLTANQTLTLNTWKLLNLLNVK